MSPSCGACHADLTAPDWMAVWLVQHDTGNVFVGPTGALHRCPGVSEATQRRAVRAVRRRGRGPSESPLRWSAVVRLGTESERIITEGS